MPPSRDCRIKSSWAIAGLILTMAACTPPGGGYPSPVTLDIGWNDLPAPGLCRAWVSGLPTEAQPRPQGCRGIEYAAPLGSRILYRPDDGTRRVVVCYLSTSDPREIIGADLFDVDSGRLLEVLQHYGEEPSEGGCQGALRKESI